MDEQIERILEFENGIIEGDVVREITQVFSYLDKSFSQRKSYDEYYYTETVVVVDVEVINELNSLGYTISIDSEYIKIK